MPSAPTVWPLVERLLARHLPERCLTTTLGDLFEDYQQHLATHGRLRAELWLAGECLSLVSTYRAARRRLVLPGRPTMDVLRSDVVHAWRAMRARPGATLSTVAVLTLGIGLVSAMFALSDPYLLRPLPFAKADELYSLTLWTRSQPDVPTLDDLERRKELFAGVLAQRSPQSAAIATDRGDETLSLVAISRSYFDVLGLPTTMPADWRPAGPAAETPLILTAEAVTRIFGNDAPIGQLIRGAEASSSFRVVGALTAPFVSPLARPGTLVDGFVPIDEGPLLSIEAMGRGYRSSGPSVIARLQPAVTPEIVEAALSTVRLDSRSAPAPAEGIAVHTDSVATLMTAPVRPLALGALAAGVLILIVCATNVANLLLVRGAARTREFASREALGASRGDIARLMLVELALLTTLGVVGGLTLAKLALTTAALVIPAEYTTLGAPAITMRVVTLASFAGGLVMMAGLIPGWAAWRISPLALFNRIATTETIRVRALRFSMTAAQTAIAVLLLVGAVLFGRSYAKLLAQDPGYDRDTFAVTATYGFGGSGASAGAPSLAPVIDATVERLRRIPGVTHAGASPGPLVDGLNMGGVFAMTIDGERVPGLPRPATRGFFEASGSRLVAGRLWTGDEDGLTVVVTESFANGCCDGRFPVGRTITINDRPFEIVGVIKDPFTNALDQPPGPVVFVPIDSGQGVQLGWVNYVIRSNGPRSELALAAEREVKAETSGVIIRGGATMRERLMQSIRDRSFATLIVVFFGIAAIGISAAGVAGVVGFVVARRTREIAIRLAVGATAGNVRRLVTREAAVAAAVGAAAGLASARWLSKTVESLLYGIEPADPWSFVIAAAAIVMVVVSAAWIPARRASRLSPTIALRAE